MIIVGNEQVYCGKCFIKKDLEELKYFTVNLGLVVYREGLLCPVCELDYRVMNYRLHHREDLERNYKGNYP